MAHNFVETMLWQGTMFSGAFYGGLYWLINNEATCISNCREQVWACSKDMSCNSAVMCHLWHKGSQSGNFLCSQTYESELFDDWMKCMFVDEKCMTVGTDLEAECAEMKTVDAPASAIAGEWTQMFGTNADFDCMDCRQATIAVSEAEATMDTKYRLDDSWGWKKNKNLSMSGSFANGVLDMTYSESGFVHSMKFSVLYADDDSMVTHYCGGGVDIDGMAWDGVQIWSRFDHMEPAKATTLKKMASDLTGFSTSDFCKLKPATCKKLK